MIEGGTEELKAIHDDLVSKGVEILPMIDYGYTRSFYINDPDGNRIEIYCELLEPLSAKKFMINREGKGKVFEWDEVLDDSGRSDHGVSKLHR